MRAPFAALVAAVALCALPGCIADTAEPVAAATLPPFSLTVTMPTLAPYPTSSPTPTPSPTPLPTPPPAQPFAVAVTNIELQPIGNGEILGIASTPADHQAALTAVEGARVTLEDYLDAQFVAPATRFTAAPLGGLLSHQAAVLLDDAGRQALGVLGQPVVATTTGTATAEAAVRLDGSAVLSVTLTYQAQLTAALAWGTQTPITQRGTVVLIPTEAGWRATAADVTLDAPGLAP